jgi:hypothetical protein
MKQSQKSKKAGKEKDSIKSKKLTEKALKYIKGGCRSRGCPTRDECPWICYF